MERFKKDPVLPLAEGIIWLMLVLVAIAGAAVLIAAPAVVFFGSELGDTVDVANVTLTLRIWTGVLLLGAAGLLYLGWRFFRAMQAIVRSVGYGDPFVHKNADRLTQMAWLFLAITVLSMPLGWLGAYIAQSLGEEAIHAGFSFDLSSLLLILVLFILARVFRRGAEMRDDLEGTV